MRFIALAILFCTFSAIWGETSKEKKEWLLKRMIDQSVNAKRGWNDTCIVHTNYTLDINTFVTRCKHKGRLQSDLYLEGKCLEMDMSLFNETQFNHVFRHAVEILGITMVFNNTQHVFLKMENLRWCHPNSQGLCRFNEDADLSNTKCLNDRFYASYEMCDHVMVIENNRFLEHILIYRPTLDLSASHPVEESLKKEAIVISNNPKLDPPFIQKMAKLFMIRKWSKLFRQYYTCFPQVPVKNLSELKDCRHIGHDLIIDGFTKMDMKTASLMHIKYIDGCIQIKDTAWKAEQVRFINEGTKAAERCQNSSYRSTELSGNKNLCVTYPLWFLFQKNFSGNKDGKECEKPVEKNCKGRTIGTVQDLLRLERCTVVTGSLIIQGLTIQYPRHLKALNDIEKIERRLTIRNCTVKHVMLASLRSVGSGLQGVKMRIKNIRGLKTVNVPSLWIGLDRGHAIEISGCHGYRRPIHLGASFDGRKNVRREVVPLELPNFQRDQSEEELFYFTKYYGAPAAFFLALFNCLRECYLTEVALGRGGGGEGGIEGVKKSCQGHW